MMNDRKLKIFTWHIHGTYLYYLSQGDYLIYIPVNDKKDEGYYGRGETFPFRNNVIEVPAAEVKNLQFDVILFQTNKNFLVDQYDVLSEEQRTLPRIYLEHDPPGLHPTDSIHPMNNPDVLMVHVTHYNRLMWKSNARVIKVIEHGITRPTAPYTGKMDRGIVVINHLHQRGRKLGADIFDEVKKKIPLDLVGMGTLEYGGMGEVKHGDLAKFISQYRFFFNPIRYTSFGLAVCEAMAAGMPVVALATTEYGTIIKDGVNGYIHTNIDYLVEKMQLLIHDKKLAETLGRAAKKTAVDQFSIERFTSQWQQLFDLAITINKVTYEKENSIY